MKKTWPFIAIAIFALVIAACGAGDGTEGGAAENGEAKDTGEGASSGEDTASERSTLQKILDEGKVTIGIANEKPYGYKETDGTVTGEGPEIAKAIFRDLGVDDINGEVVDFGALIPGLQSERFDLVTAGMDIRPERCAEADFADIEIRYGEGLIVQKGNPHGLHSYEDIAANPDVKVSIMAGANENDFLKALGVADEQIVTAPDIASNVAAVASGRADATTMTEATAREAYEDGDHDKIELADPFEQPVIDGKSVMSYGAAAFRQGDVELREAYNEGLKKLHDSGELLDILEQFGFSEDNLPDDGMTTEKRCAGE